MLPGNLPDDITHLPFSHPTFTDTSEIDSYIHLHPTVKHVPVPKRPSKRGARRINYQKRKAVDDALTELKKGKDIVAEIWTDASVLPTAAAGAFGWFKRPNSKGTWRPVTCGKHSCSFRAEGETMVKALEHLLRWMHSVNRRRYRSKHFILVSDSQSFLRSLEKGPLSLKPKDDLQQQAWHTLTEIAKLRAHVSLQFTYSHCGVKRNELADVWADTFRDKYPMPPPKLWYTDELNLQWQSIKKSYMNNLDMTCYREGNVSIKPTKVYKNGNRTQETRLARARTGESLDFGIFIRRTGQHPTMACRWCHPETCEPTDTPPPISGGWVLSTEPQKCLDCTATLANVKSMRTHYKSKHPSTPLPEKWVSKQRTQPPTAPQPAAPPTQKCKHCNEVKPPGHERLCPKRPNTPKQRDRPTSLDMTVDDAETINHLLTCTAINDGLRRNLPEDPVRLYRSNRLATFLMKIQAALAPTQPVPTTQPSTHPPPTRRVIFAPHRNTVRRVPPYLRADTEERKASRRAGKKWRELRKHYRNEGAVRNLRFYETGTYNQSLDEDYNQLPISPIQSDSDDFSSSPEDEYLARYNGRMR